MEPYTTFPLAGLTEGGLTVNQLIQEPKQIASFIAAQIQANISAQFIFTPTGTSGGALIFGQNDGTLADVDDPGTIAPGAEYPVIGGENLEPKNVSVQKFGGKFSITDEAAKRNDTGVVQRHAKLVATKMSREIDARGWQALNEAVTELGEKALVVNSGGWQAALGVSASAKTAKTGEGQVLSDLIDAQLAVEESGYLADTFVTSPRNHAALKKLLGLEGYRGVLAELGLTPFTSNEVSDSDGLVFQRGVVGVLGVEAPITVEDWRDPSKDTHWIKTHATLAYGVTDPLAIAKITGLEG